MGFYGIMLLNNTQEYSSIKRARVRLAFRIESPVCNAIEEINNYIRKKVILQPTGPLIL
jgi:hypothetical protein